MSGSEAEYRPAAGPAAPTPTPTPKTRRMMISAAATPAW